MRSADAEAHKSNPEQRNRAGRWNPHYKAMAGCWEIGTLTDDPILNYRVRVPSEAAPVGR